MRHGSCRDCIAALAHDDQKPEVVRPEGSTLGVWRQGHQIDRLTVLARPVDRRHEVDRDERSFARSQPVQRHRWTRADSAGFGALEPERLHAVVWDRDAEVNGRAEREGSWDADDAAGKAQSAARRTARCGREFADDAGVDPPPAKTFEASPAVVRAAQPAARTSGTAATAWRVSLAALPIPARQLVADDRGGGLR
jgi:hypothetical protein